MIIYDYYFWFQLYLSQFPSMLHMDMYRTVFV